MKKVAATVRVRYLNPRGGFAGYWPSRWTRLSLKGAPALCTLLEARWPVDPFGSAAVYGDSFRMVLQGLLVYDESFRMVLSSSVWRVVSHGAVLVGMAIRFAWCRGAVYGDSFRMVQWLLVYGDSFRMVQGGSVWRFVSHGAAQQCMVIRFAWCRAAVYGDSFRMVQGSSVWRFVSHGAMQQCMAIRFAWCLDWQRG